MSGKKTILLLEDDLILGPSIRLTLEAENFQVVWFTNIKEAQDGLKKHNIDLYLIDYTLPDGKGIEFCKNIREQERSEPVIFVTAELDEDIVVTALQAGANDYIRKPFGNKELLARIVRHLEINSKLLPMKFKELALDNQNLTLSCRFKNVELSRREFEIMKLLIQAGGGLVSKDRLVYSGNAEVQDNTIDSHISHIRKKLKQVASNEYQITSVYGAGYRLTTSNEPQ